MGADFIFATAPACGLDEGRRKVLSEIIAGLPDDAFPDYMDDITEWRGRLKDAITALDARRRDVSRLEWCSDDYPVFITGGMSWGDSPTEAMDYFSDLSECDPLWEQLEEWARADAEPVMSARVKALVEAADTLLANLIDAGEYGPGIEGDEDDLPHDEDGDPWYGDVHALAETLKPFRATEQAS